MHDALLNSIEELGYMYLCSGCFMFLLICTQQHGGTKAVVQQKEFRAMHACGPHQQAASFRGDEKRMQSE